MSEQTDADGTSRPRGADGASAAVEPSPSRAPSRRGGAPRPPRPRGVIGPFTGRQLAVIAIVVVVAVVALKALTIPVGNAAPAVPKPGASFVAFAPAQAGLQAGERAPELSGTSGQSTVALTDLEGRPISLAALRGHPVWINFFATWCPPCQSETPTIEQVYETHRAQGLEVIGVSVQESSVDDVRTYARTYGLQYTIGFDGTSAVYRSYHVFGLPTQVFIDRNGIVRQVWNGPLSQLQAEQFLAPILEPAAGSSAAPVASPTTSSAP